MIIRPSGLHFLPADPFAVEKDLENAKGGDVKPHATAPGRQSEIPPESDQTRAGFEVRTGIVKEAFALDLKGMGIMSDALIGMTDESRVLHKIPSVSHSDSTAPVLLPQAAMPIGVRRRTRRSFLF